MPMSSVPSDDILNTQWFNNPVFTIASTKTRSKKITNKPEGVKVTAGTTGSVASAQSGSRAANSATNRLLIVRRLTNTHGMNCVQ
jgi:hypothetical protein